MESTMALEAEKLQKVIEAANQKVDAILAAEARAQKMEKHKRWSGRETMPDPIRELLDVFVKVTGITPGKRDLMQWLMEGQEWLNIGLIPQDIEAANNHANLPGGFLVVSPMSLTKTAKALAAKRRVSSYSADAVKERTAEILAERDTWKRTECPEDLRQKTRARLASINAQREAERNGTHGK